jgi:hypothetical protein
MVAFGLMANKSMLQCEYCGNRTYKNVMRRSTLPNPEPSILSAWRTKRREHKQFEMNEAKAREEEERKARAAIPGRYPAEVPAGWYPDPSGQPGRGDIRYWDGNQWTGNTAYPRRGTI